MVCLHVWRETESDNLGKPVKYECIDCGAIYNIKPNRDITDYFRDYFNTMNDIINRIAENQQKLALIDLQKNGFNKNIHKLHLIKENKTLAKLLSNYL